MPLAMALRRARPDVELVWVTQPEARPLLAGHPAVSRVEVFPRRSSVGRLARALRRLRSMRTELLLDPQGNLKSAAISRVIRATRRIGPHPEDTREWPSRYAYRERIDPYDPASHVVDRYLSFAAHLGVEDLSVDFGLTATEDERAAAERDLAAVGLPAPTPIVVLQVGSLDDVRQWRAERMAAVADALAGREGYGAVVTTGPAHVGDGRTVAGCLEKARHRDASGSLDLRGLLALFAVLSSRPGSFLLSGDTAPLHLAVATGLRVIGLYGSQPVGRTGPYRRTADAITLEGGLPCVPCRRRECRLREAPRACMDRISVEDVLDRVRSGPGQPRAESGSRA